MSRSRGTKIHTSAAPAVLFFALALSLTCDKSPTGPEPIKDPRTYTWTVDTLSIPTEQILMHRIWGSTSDLYAVGHSSSSTGTMWHFNGTRWANVKLGTFEGGPIETFSSTYDLWDICGFSSGSIIAVGRRRFGTDSSFIVEHDGQSWQEHKVSGGRFLLSVWGSARNNVWAAGVGGTVLHYDGVGWSRD